MSRLGIILSVLAIAVLFAVPFATNPFVATLLTRVLIYAIFAMSLDLLLGYCGLVSLGHAAFFGVSAYTVAALAVKAGTTSIWITLPASLVASALTALIIGSLVLRTSGVYFIMVTLAFAQMIYFIFHDSSYFGGSDGLLVLHSLRAQIGGLTLLDLGDRLTLYYVSLAAVVGVFAGLSVLVRSPFGCVIQGIRSNERRMRALGYATFRYKLACFVIAGTLAGLAGYLHVALTSLADPSIIDWLHSAQVLIILILGGIGTLLGPIVGAFALIIFIDQASELTEHWKLYLGILIIVSALGSRGGITGLLSSAIGRLEEERSCR